MKIHIKITQNILEKTKNCPRLELSKNCAISESIREILPYAAVISDEIYPHFYAPESRDVIEQINTSIILPLEAQEFIALFDAKEPESRAKMEPISFDIDVPNELIAQIGIQEVYSVLSTSRTLELVEI